MATQAALIADTIVGMKRALRRERDGKTLISPRCPFFYPLIRQATQHC